MNGPWRGDIRDGIGARTGERSARSCATSLSHTLPRELRLPSSSRRTMRRSRAGSQLCRLAARGTGARGRADDARTARRRHRLARDAERLPDRLATARRDDRRLVRRPGLNLARAPASPMCSIIPTASSCSRRRRESAQLARAPCRSRRARSRVETIDVDAVRSCFADAPRAVELEPLDAERRRAADVHLRHDRHAEGRDAHAGATSSRRARDRRRARA